MDKKIISTGAMLGMTSIILGAFGAHALKKALTIQELSTFETGVKYQMYQALFLLFVGLIHFIPEKTKKTIWLLVVFGTIFFSGSIYLLSTQSLSGINFKTIGFVTPIGGFLLILAWGILVINSIRRNS